MTLKERFIEWAEKRDKKLLEQDTVSGLYKRNKRYHRYFEGYTEYTQLNERGHLKIVRVYTGQYYRADISTAIYAVTRIVYILCWIIAVICQVTSTIADYPYNYAWYVTVPEALGFPASFALMLAVFNAALTERKLKIRQYRTIHNLTRFIAFAGFGVHLLTSLCMCINIFITSSAASSGIWWAPLKMLAASACFLAVGMIERKIPYVTEENPTQPIPGGVEIRR